MACKGSRQCQYLHPCTHHLFFEARKCIRRTPPPWGRRERLCGTALQHDLPTNGRASVDYPGDAGGQGDQLWQISAILTDLAFKV